MRSRATRTVVHLHRYPHPMKLSHLTNTPRTTLHQDVSCGRGNAHNAVRSTPHPRPSKVHRRNTTRTASADVSHSDTRPPPVAPIPIPRPRSFDPPTPADGTTATKARKSWRFKAGAQRLATLTLTLHQQRRRPSILRGGQPIHRRTRSRASSPQHRGDRSTVPS